MNKTFKLVGAAILALGVSAVAAQASPTFTSGQFDVSIAMNPSLSAFPSGANTGIFGINTSTNNTFATSPSGDFSSFISPLVAFTSPAGALNFNNLSTLGFSVNDSATLGTFTATSVVGNGTPDGSNHVVYDVIGTWTIGSDFVNAGNIANADILWTFAINGQNVGGNGIFNANVPEPSTLSLFGASLLGFGFLQLRKKRKSVLAA